MTYSLSFFLAGRSITHLPLLSFLYLVSYIVLVTYNGIRLPAVGTLKRYSKALEYEYRVKTDTLKRYSILSLTLYLE
jgi:hypothetical protein